MPRASATATRSAGTGVIAPETAAVSGGLRVFSRANPGVFVSGGYSTLTRTPCGSTSYRSAWLNPRTAHFVGVYPVYPTTPMSPAVELTVTM